MKKIFISFALLLTLTNLFGQIDYLEVKDQIRASCGKISSEDILGDKAFIDSLMQFEIIKGEDKFLYDAGMTYYVMYLKWKNKEDIVKSIEFNQKCWDKYHNLRSLWNLGTNYGILENCEKKIELTELYINEMKKDSLEKFIDYQQIYFRYKFCRNK